MTSNVIVFLVVLSTMMYVPFLLKVVTYVEFLLGRSASNDTGDPARVVAVWSFFSLLMKKNRDFALIFTQDGLKPAVVISVCRAATADAVVHVAAGPDGPLDDDPDGARELLFPPPLVQAVVTLVAMSIAMTALDPFMASPVRAESVQQV
jgi:hypothetical protein